MENKQEEVRKSEEALEGKSAHALDVILGKEGLRDRVEDESVWGYSGSWATKEKLVLLYNAKSGLYEREDWSERRYKLVLDSEGNKIFKPAYSEEWDDEWEKYWYEFLMGYSADKDGIAVDKFGKTYKRRIDSDGYVHITTGRVNVRGVFVEYNSPSDCCKCCIEVDVPKKSKKKGGKLL